MVAKSVYKFAFMAAIFAVAFSGNIGAQQSEDNLESVPLLPPVIVEGVTQKQAFQFADRVVPRIRGVDGIARWNKDLCVSVLGLNVKQGQAVADQISMRAIGLGLKPGAPGCDTNLLIVFSDNPKAIMPTLSERHRAFLAINNEKTDTLGTGALNHFLNSDRPVRWWHVIEKFSKSGVPINGDAYDVGTKGNGNFPRQGGLVNVPTVRNSDASRLGGNVRADISRAIVVIDLSKAKGMSVASLADLAAMPGLAMLDPELDAQGLDSILNLLSDDNAPAGMTSWDCAFLDGLYRSDRNPASIKRHLADIAHRMVSSEP
jgi:hypothetical protein